MRLAQIGDAERLARKLINMKTRREEWSNVDLTVATLARRINDCGTHDPKHVPSIDDDVQMHGAIVRAIIAEYTRRIEDAASELVNMGVEL